MLKKKRRKSNFYYLISVRTFKKRPLYKEKILTTLQQNTYYALCILSEIVNFRVERLIFN